MFPSFFEPPLAGMWPRPHVARSPGGYSSMAILRSSGSPSPLRPVLCMFVDGQRADICRMHRRMRDCNTKTSRTPNCREAHLGGSVRSSAHICDFLIGGESAPRSDQGRAVHGKDSEHSRVVAKPTEQIEGRTGFVAITLRHCHSHSPFVPLAPSHVI